jgi:hypothetical protein
LAFYGLVEYEVKLESSIPISHWSGKEKAFLSWSGYFLKYFDLQSGSCVEQMSMYSGAPFWDSEAV